MIIISNELRGWIKNFINHYRSEVEKLTKKFNIIITNANDLSSPLQIDVLWIIDKKKNDKQLFFFYHNNNESDLEINVYGPYDVSIPDNSEKINQFIHQEKFKNRYYYPNKSTTYSEILETKVINILSKTIENPSKGFQSGSMLGTKTKDYIKVKFGRIQDIDFNILANELINRIMNEQIMLRSLSKIKDKEKLGGIGGFIKPSIWIGEKPEPQISSKYLSHRVVKYIDIIINQNYKNRKLIVKTDGFIAIFLRKEDYIPTEFPTPGKLFILIKYLNEIFSIMLLFGFNVTSVESNDFLLVHYIPETKFLSETHKGNSYGESQFLKRSKNFIDYEFQKDYTLFPLYKFKIVLRTAEIVCSEDNLGEIPVLLLQSYSNLNRGEFSQSFILGWTIIEYFINKLWENHISMINSLDLLKDYLKKCFSKFSSNLKDLLNNTNSLSKEEETIINNLNEKFKLNIENVESIENLKDYLINSRDVTVSFKLEIMYNERLITENDYKIIDNLRDKRNKFIHENTPIDSMTSDKCYKISFRIVKSLISGIEI